MKMMKSNVKTASLLLLTCSMTASCVDHEIYSYKGEEFLQQISQREEAFKEAVGGEIDPDHTWVSARKITLNIQAMGSCQIAVYSTEEEVRECYGKLNIQNNGQMLVFLPEGNVEQLLVTCLDANGTTHYEYITPEQKESQDITVNFTPKIMAGGTRAAFNPNGINEKLITQSYQPNCGYHNFPGDLWQTLLAAAPEAKAVDPDNTVHAVNYKLESRGPFYIAFAYGDTGTRDECVLGYYHYKGNDLSTMELVPFVESNLKDYHYFEDGEEVKCKVQYALKDNVNQWLDTNFDHWDQNVEGVVGTTPVTNAARKGDNVFNIAKVNEANKGNIDGIRGVLYKIDVPVGENIGFYLTRNSSNNDQRKKLVEMGVPSAALTAPNFRGNATFSDARFNMPIKDKTYRSLIRYYKGFIFMGLDDSAVGSCDYDCNDVTFCLVPGNGILPGVYLPYVVDFGNPAKPHDKPLYYNPDQSKTEDPKDTEYLEMDTPWTFAFEDTPTASDFDFNDIVLQVYDQKGTADVYLCAAGGKLPTEIYFKDQLLCKDAHETLGNTMANTGNATTLKHVKIATLKFSGDQYDFGANAKDFRIRVQDVDKDGNKGEWRFVDVSTRAQEGCRAPMAVVMKYAWQWPTESTRIFDAYPQFALWAQDQSNTDAQGWYRKENMKEGKCTLHNKNGEPAHK